LLPLSYIAADDGAGVAYRDAGSTRRRSEDVVVYVKRLVSQEEVAAGDGLTVVEKVHVTY